MLSWFSPTIPHIGVKDSRLAVSDFLDSFRIVGDAVMFSEVKRARNARLIRGIDLAVAQTTFEFRGTHCRFPCSNCDFSLHLASGEQFAGLE
jgi:hypothetical protein